MPMKLLKKVFCMIVFCYTLYFYFKSTYWTGLLTPSYTLINNFVNNKIKKITDGCKSNWYKALEVLEPLIKDGFIIQKNISNLRAI